MAKQEILAATHTPVRKPENVKIFSFNTIAIPQEQLNPITQMRTMGMTLNALGLGDDGILYEYQWRIKEWVEKLG